MDRISIGFPGRVRWGQIIDEAVNLGLGWVGIDFSQEFDCPVRVMNDADMQALGGYSGGRVLYLGFGTGVGTSMVIDGHISPLALGLLPYKSGRKFDQYLTNDALDRIGLKRWREAATDAATIFKDAMIAD
ncbi:ROK family protein [Lacipirellula sp.]|uniref:ROK family protein n=1 Tax=Lacipirellula sp. TaxID=2691419 RepID=UPI003D0C6E2C